MGANPCPKGDGKLGRALWRRSNVKAGMRFQALAAAVLRWACYNWHSSPQPSRAVWSEGEVQGRVTFQSA